MTALLCVSFCVAGTAWAQRRAQVVQVYFVRNEETKTTARFVFVPVTRRVAGRDAPRQTVLALLRGATEAEKKKGIYGVDTKGLTLRSLRTKGGSVVVSLAADKNRTWIGDSSVGHLEEALTKTLHQFPIYKGKKVTVLVNGVVPDSFQ